MAARRTVAARPDRDANQPVDDEAERPAVDDGSVQGFCDTSWRFDTLTTGRPSNWGRWGADDERGTLNLLSPERILRAVGLVRRGRVYSLQTPLSKDSPIAPSRSPLWHRTTVSNRPGA